MAQGMRSGVAWNLAGQVFTSTIGFLAVPIFLALVGEARMGVANLAGSMLFYLLFMDLGLGQALIQVLSTKIAAGESAQGEGILRASVRIVGGLSVVGALGVCALSIPLAYQWLKVPPELRLEAALAFSISGLSIPVVLVTNLFRATLIAGGRFRELNLQRMLAHGLHWGALLLGSWASHRIDVALGLTLVSNLAMMIWSWRIATEVLPERGPDLGLAKLRPILTMSGWMMVSSLVTPFLTQAERWVIGLKVGVEALAWYSTPVELAQKIFIAQGALMGVVLPNLARARVGDPAGASRLYLRFLWLQLGIFAPLCAIGALVAPEFLGAWLGENFRQFGSDPMKIACAGVVLNLMGSAGYTLAVAAGRTDLAGKIHLSQVVPYLLLVWFVVPRWGIVGAAWIWTFRIAIDAGLFLFLTRTLLDDTAGRGWVLAAWIMAIATSAAVAAQVFAEGLLQRLSLMLPILAMAGVATLLSRRFAGKRPEAS